jgi:hypothetical protein
MKWLSEEGFVTGLLYLTLALLTPLSWVLQFVEYIAAKTFNVGER